MRELIVVGMRFYPEYKECKINRNSEIMLVAEPDNPVNHKAIAVYSLNENIWKKIGHIRDQDLPSIDRKQFTSKVFNDATYYVQPYLFVVDRVCPNYLRIVQTNIRVVPLTNSTPKDLHALWHANEYASEVKTQADYVSNNFICSDVDAIKNHINTAASNASFTEMLINKRQEETKSKPKEEKKMINTSTMRDSFFKEVKNVALDMQSGKLGVITKDGIVVATEDGVSINPITEMGFTIPAFAMRVPVEQLVKGDIIITSGDPVFFREGSKAGYLTTNTSGVYQETGIVSNMFFGKNTVMAVKNMFGDADNQAGGMNPMLMMAMMGDKDGASGGFDFKKMMMFQMMSGMGGSGANQMNPLMMAMMFSDKL